MKKLLALMVSFGLMACLVGCPGEKPKPGDPPKTTPPVSNVDDAQLAEKEITLAPGDHKEVKISSGKELEATVKPTDSKVTAKVKDDKTLTVEVPAEEKEGTATVTVKGKGKGADLKVVVKKKAEDVVKPPKKDDAVKLEKDRVEVEEGKTAEVKVTEGKIKSVRVEPSDSTVKATVGEDGKSVKVDATGAKDKAAGTVMIMGTEGKAELKVTVIKK